jgi:predicted flap endonuclease-1-like 5' DNA nuclease
MADHIKDAARCVALLMERKVKGIGEKRAEQLKALGISSAEDLAKASVEDLATKLKVSPKFTGKWIENSKQLVKKP